MDVNDLIRVLRNKGLDVHVKMERPQDYVVLNYQDEKRGKKFLEITGSEENPVIKKIKFHKETSIPASVKSKITSSGDSGPINLQIVNGSDQEYIELAIASYNKIKELWLYKEKTKNN